MLLLTSCGFDGDSDAPMELKGTVEVDQLVLAADAYGDKLVTLSLSENETEVALNVLEVDDDGTLQKLGSLTAPGDGYDFTSFTSTGLAVEDDVVYVALTHFNQSAVWAVDISEPEQPMEQSLLETPNVMPVSIATSGDLAAVGTGLIGTGVTLVDISSPDAIERIGAFEHFAPSTAKVALTEDYAYLGDRSGVAVIDVTDPREPEEAGFYENPIWEGIPSIEGGATTSSISTENRPGFPDIAIVGDYVLMTTVADTLEILNVSDPENIEPVAQVETEFASIAVTVSGDFAYVYSRGELEPGITLDDLPFMLQKIDISNAEEPEVVQELEVNGGLPSAWQSIVASDEYLFVLNGNSIDVIAIAD